LPLNSLFDSHCLQDKTSATIHNVVYRLAYFAVIVKQ